VFRRQRDLAIVCGSAGRQRKEEQHMPILRTLQNGVAATLVLTGLGLAVAEARPMAQPQGEFINQPGNPFVCRTDEGYGRWTSCDNGG
jgi:hypothetical protein